MKVTFIVFSGSGGAIYRCNRFKTIESLIEFAEQRLDEWSRRDAAKQPQSLEQWARQATPGDRTAWYELDWVIALDAAKDSDGLVEYED